MRAKDSKHTLRAALQPESWPDQLCIAGRAVLCWGVRQGSSTLFSYGEALVEISWGWAYLFTLYVCIALFAVLNVMTGVFCQSAIENAEKDHELSMASMMNEKQEMVNTSAGYDDSPEGMFSLHSPLGCVCLIL